MTDLLDYIKDWWLTWRTGKNKSEREWDAWYNENINWLSPRVSSMFEKFKHVIEVDKDKFFQFDPFAWVPCEDAKQYFWPARKLGTNAVWRIEQVIPYGSDDYYINGIGGESKVFVVTNNDRDAMMIALKYMS